jgi:hypothetical protein
MAAEPYYTTLCNLYRQRQLLLELGLARRPCAEAIGGATATPGANLVA